MSIFHANLLTIFPEMFPGPLQYSLAGQALKNDIWSYEAINIKNFGRTKHQKFDDEPYGGGDGLIMRADVAALALDNILLARPNSPVYYPSPRGKIFNQAMAKEIIQQKNIVILCGRFEGIDERIIDEYNVQEISVGDYILSGGEIAAITILDSIIRLLPGVLQNQQTLCAESFEAEYQGYLEPPLYTRPSCWRGRDVPEILLSGHHEKIKQWKIQESEKITKIRRPDLLK